MPQLPSGVNGTQATLAADGLIYITGGADTQPNYSSKLTDTYILDPRTRAMVSGPHLPEAHAYHAAVLGSDGHVYVIGGSTTPLGHNGYGQVSKLNVVGSAAPEFLTAPQRYALVGEAYNTGAFFKANPRPAYALVDGPSGLTVDAQSGALLWSPTLTQVGVHQVTLQATNEFGTTEATFTVDVLEEVPDIIAPSTPTNLHETGATDTTITLSWDAATDDRGVSHYKLYKYHKINRWRSTSILVADNITDTSYTITGLASGSGGKYSVATVDTSGNESRRSASLLTTTNYAPIVYSSNSGDFVYAIAGDGLHVGYSNYHFTPQSYKVTGYGKPAPTLSIVGSPAGVTVDQTTGIVSWTPSAADVGSATITVRGANSAGTDDLTFSFDVFAAGTDVNPPTAPVRIQVANTTSTGASVSWDAASDDYGVAGYQLKMKKYGNSNPIFVVADVPSTQLTYAIGGLEANTRYILYITAHDAAGNESSLGYGPSFTTLNNAPTALHDIYDATEDSQLTIAAADGVLLNDSDPDGAPITAVLAAAPANGTVTLNADGSFTYSPGPNFNGRDSFTYQANDGRDNSTIATVTIDVGAVDDAGLAENDAYNIGKNTQLDVTIAAGLLANDVEVDGQTLTAVLVQSPANGTVTLDGDGSFSYVPAIDFNGIDTFTYKNNDGGLDSNIATVSVTVGAPTASDDAYTTDEDAQLSVAASGVLANDADSEGDPITTVLVDDAAHGALILNANGSFTYLPDANFNGSDSFTYRASDGSLNSNLATVAITVNAVNDAPAAGDDTYSTNEDTVLGIATVSGVLANDADIDGDALAVAVVGQPAHGTLTLNANGSFSYMPAADYYGLDSFSYRANDGSLDSNVATVAITINSVNDKPVAGDDAYSVAEDNTLTVDAPTGLLANDSDVEGDAMTALRVLNPSHGTVTVNADGSFSYTPHADFNGADSFTYRANDGAVGSAAATVTISVYAVNDAPSAAADGYTATQDKTLTINSTDGVLTNDADVDGDPLTTVFGDSPLHGTITLNANGSFNYVPDAGFNGSDTFTYRASDGDLTSAATTVVITVDAAANNVPVAVNDSATTNKDVAVAVNVLANDTDGDGDSLSVAIVSNPTNGSTVVNTNGTVTYTPIAGFTGADSFTYRASDGTDNSNVATVSITVNNPASGTKFYVVDFTAKNTFEYAANGDLVEDYNLAGANSKPQGAASSADGTTVWVVNKSGKVYVYDNDGVSKGSWTPTGPVKFDGIATDENSVWIVDRETDKAYRYIDAASRTSGTVAADSSFPLARGNKKAKGITSDGAHLWVVNDAKGTDKVFKYKIDGTLVGSWAIDSANSTPTGITIDPNNVDHVWIVDSGTDKVYQYDNGASRTSGQQDSNGDWDLAEANVDPQGIADPLAEPISYKGPFDGHDNDVAAPIDLSWITNQLKRQGARQLPLETPNRPSDSLSVGGDQPVAVPITVRANHGAAAAEVFRSLTERDKVSDLESILDEMTDDLIRDFA